MRYIFFSIFIALTFISCEEEMKDPKIYEYNIKIVGKGIDCGDIVLADIVNDQEDFNSKMNTTSSRIYALNLEERFKNTGLELRVNLRKPEAGKEMACTMFGPTYPQIVIIKVVEF